MKKLLAAAFITFVSSAALADGAPCEDTARLIAKLESQLKSASGSQAQNIKGLLAAARETFKANGCK